MVKDGYKETEIGLIPEDWESVELLSKCNLLNGLTYTPNDIAKNGLLVLRSSNIQNNQLTFLDNVYVNLTVDEEKLIKKDDIVICVRNGSATLIGKCAKASKNYPVTFGAFMAVLRGKNNEYIFQLLQQGTIQKNISKNSGATINQITNGDFKTMLVPFPSDKKEQKRIAEALSDMDNLISSLEKLIEKKKAIKQACLQKMFPKDGKAVPEMRLPGFTNAWEQRKLGEVVNIYDGIHQTPDYKNDGVMFLSVENISTLKSEKYISDEAFQRDYKVYPQNGDILMTRIGDVGTPNVIDTSEKVAFYVSLALLKPIKINSYFLCNAIKSPFFQKELKDRTLVTAIPQKINKDEIGKVNILLPNSSEEQRLIGEHFRDLDNLITIHQRKLEKYKKLKQGMMQQLLTGKIRLV